MSGYKKMVKIFALLIIVIMMAACKESAQVSSIFWKHDVFLQQRIIAHNSGEWASKMPAGAFNKICEPRQSGTTSCNPHMCYKYDFFTSKWKWKTCYDKCPVYKSWCAYDYYDWETIDIKTTQGISHNESWLALEAHGEDQRIVREVEYVVMFKNEKGENRRFNANVLDEFLKFKVGDWWVIKISGNGRAFPQNKLVMEE